MSTNVLVPELGESVVEARVAKWLKREGEPVAAGEPLVELETEKTDLEVSATRSGVLTRIAQTDGADVKIGEVLGVIEDAATAGSRGAAEDAETRTSGSRGAAEDAEPETRQRVTPSAQRFAREHDVDLSAVRGTGAAGRVMRQDVETHLTDGARAGAKAGPEEPEAPPAPPAASSTNARPPQPTGYGPQRGPASGVERAESRAPLDNARGVVSDGRTAQRSEPGFGAEPRSRKEERIRMSKRRLTIARRLVEAQHTAAMLTTFNEIDMSAVMDLRQRRRDEFKARHGTSLGIASFFVKASIAALREFPRLNAEIQGEAMILKQYYDIGMAVGAAEGLVVPVIRDADQLSFAEIEHAIKAFSQKAGDRTLSLEDLRGGTFTITNGGVFGSLMSTPILNPPQVGILGLHKIQDRAIPINGQVAIRAMMYVALSYDHRIVDGREAVQFLVRVKQFVEDPGSLLIEA
jgi:2-oxoglutarate dehydrogenase E2 component (dihydrolipoamide succinyltransferase)